MCAFPAWHAFRVAVVSSWPVWCRPLSSEDRVEERVEDRVEDRGKIVGGMGGAEGFDSDATEEGAEPCRLVPRRSCG